MTKSVPLSLPLPATLADPSARVPTVTALAMFALCTGCASSGEDAGGGATGRAETAVVVAVLTRGTDETYQTYLLADERAPVGTLDLSRALELPDALVTQSEEAIFVGDNERITLQRYEVNADYSFTMTGELSLQGYGVDYINNEPLFFSPTSAYYVDAPRGQIITFNPSSMEITGDIQVPELLREDYVVWLGPPQRVGNRYLANVLYTDEDWTATPADSTVGVIIEEDQSEPIQLLRDDRGVGAYLSFADESGDFYFAADGLSGNLALSKLQDVPTSRVLRVREGQNVVDPSFMLDLGQLLNTPATFGFWPVTSTQFVVQAWASDVDPETVLEPGEGGWGTSYYDWMLIDAKSGEAEPVRGLERSVANNTLRIRLDGRTYMQRLLDGGGRAELYALGDDASAEKVAETNNGEFWFLGRVSRPR
jgi:hypothetical protein